MAIDVKSAVLSASQYLADVMRIPTQALVLEEVELSGDGRFWEITFSYPTPETPDLAHVLRSRSYKVVKVDADDGGLASIKIKRL